MLDAGHELAEQHGEAAVADMKDHLPAAVEDLHAVGDAEAGADRGIVERTGDPLAARLPRPIRRPERHLASVRDEDRIVSGLVADEPRDRLRMDLVAAAGGIGLLGGHRVPCAPSLPSFDEEAV